MAKTKRNFSAADRLAASNLAEIWKLKSSALSLTQEKAAGDLGMTQGAVSQYLHGKVPLRIVAAIKFAKLLKVKPTEIREDLRELTSELTPEALDFAQRFSKLKPEQQKKFEAILLLAADAVPDSKISGEWHNPETRPAKGRKRVSETR